MYKLIGTFNTLSQILQPSHEGDVINLMIGREVKFGDVSKVKPQHKAKNPTEIFIRRPFSYASLPLLHRFYP